MLIALIALALLMFALAWGLFAAQAWPAALAAHLALALGALPLITAAMQHFAPVLARTRGAGPWMRRVPALMLLAGALAATAFSGGLPFAALTLAALMALGGVAGMLVWMRALGRSALGAPHPGLAWYVAAMTCLGLALLAVPLMSVWPQAQPALRAFHLHLNLYGFIGLTAVGTLQVLLPTAAGAPDARAAHRLKADLPWALAGALGMALGAALAPWLVWVGAAAWMWVLARMLAAWFRQFRARLFAWHGAEPALLAAVFGLAAALLSADAHRFAPLEVFLPGFLMPLLTGAASVLAPVWRHPANPAAQAAGRAALGRWGGARAVLFVLSPVLALGAHPWAGAPAGLALLGFCAGFAFWWRRAPS